MGNFRIEISGVGGHGCDRVAREGEALTLALEADAVWHVAHCPDCMVADLVARMKANGAFSHGRAAATFTHWPGEPSEVVDDLLTLTRRKGSFQG